MKTDTTRFKQTGVARAVIAALCGTASMMAAQETLAQAQPSQSLQRVEITGSNIKRTDTETASPVQVLTREDIEKTGKQSIQEVLRGITADNQGSIPTSFSNGFAAGSAAVSLRGLGVNSTLVLVNGRRMTTYGLADDGTRNFVDLNSLPLEAVERVEVLKDGASAIYGADAVGGVINIILRKNYTGKSIGGSFGASQEGDGQTTRIYGSAGFGNMDTDKYNVFFTAEVSQQKNIWSIDRGFMGQQDLRSLNFFDTRNGAARPWIGAGPTANSPYGVVRNPANNARVNIVPCDPSLIIPETNLCGFNARTQQEIQPNIDRFNLFGRGTFEINPNMTAYGELGYFNTKVKANGTLGAYNDGGVFDPRSLNGPYDTLMVHGLITLPANHPDNPYPGTARPNMGLLPAELGGRDQTTDNKVWRLIGGLQGTAWGWDYDAGIGWIESKLNSHRTGYINYDNFVTAINNGTYRFAGLGASTTNPAVLASISPDMNTPSKSSVKLIDFKASRELMQLSGGPLQVAFGGEMRWESADSPPVAGTETASIAGLGYSAFSSSRKVGAIFGEVNAPVTKWLELNGALRYDHYSDFGDSTTPKVGFKIKPIDQLAIRGTYSEAFRAPGPAESGGSSFGFTSVGILSLGNSSIQPETAKSYTLGLVFEPVPGTSATVDFWRIERKNEIVQADPATIIPPGTPQDAAPFTKIPGAQPGTFIYYDSTGQLATVSGFYMNAAKTKTDGVDVELRHKMNFGEAGKMSAQLNWSHTRKYERTDPFGTTLSYEGTHGPIVLSSGGGTPKNRASLSLSWEKGPFTLSGVVNYVGGMKMVDHHGEQSTDQGDGTILDNTNGLLMPYNGTSATDCSVYGLDGTPYNGCKLPSFTTVDLYGKWTPMKNFDINFGIQNLFNKKAPFDPYLVLTYGINYNQAFHQSGAVGRYFTLGAKYSF